MAATDRDYYELLGVARDADERDDQEGVPPARARAASRRLRPTRRPRCASARSPRRTRCSRTPRRRALYDRYGHAGLRSGGFPPTHFDMGSLGDLFSAFFGDDLFGGTTGEARRARRRRRRGDRDRARRGGARGRPSRSRSRSPRRARRAAATASSPARRRAPARAATARGRLQQVSRSVFGEFVRTQPCPECRGRGVLVEHPCRECDGAGRTLEERDAERRRPRRHPRRPAHPRLAARATPARSADARATSTCSCT